MKLNLIVCGLLVVGYAHWPWTGRLAAQAREDSLLTGRHRMVGEQIKARGIKDEGVLAAMLKVPRERFVPSEVAPLAYADRPRPNDLTALHRGLHDRSTAGHEQE